MSAPGSWNEEKDDADVKPQKAAMLPLSRVA
jgi:hypothetical protein